MPDLGGNLDVPGIQAGIIYFLRVISNDNPPFLSVYSKGLKTVSVAITYFLPLFVLPHAVRKNTASKTDKRDIIILFMINDPF